MRTHAAMDAEGDGGARHEHRRVTRRVEGLARSARAREGIRLPTALACTLLSLASCRCSRGSTRHVKEPTPDAAVGPTAPPTQFVVPPATGTDGARARFASANQLVFEVSRDRDSSSGTSLLFLVDLARWRPRLIYDGPTPGSWTVNDHDVVLLADRDVIRIALGDGSIRHTKTASGANVVSPDGRFGTCLGDVCLVDLMTGRDVPLPGEDRRGCDADFVSFSPDSRLLYRSLKDHGIGVRCGFPELIELATIRMLPVRGIHDDRSVWGHADGEDNLYSVHDFPAAAATQIVALAARPSSHELAAAMTDGRVLVMKPHEANILRALNAGSLRVEAVAYSPDGARLAASAGAGTFVWDASGARLAGWEHVRAVQDLSFSPTGAKVVGTSEGRAIVLDVDTHSATWVVPEQRDGAAAEAIIVTQP